MSQQEKETKAQLFSNRLIGARNRAMLSQTELAAAVGTSLRSVQNWEKGNFEPHGKTLRKLCEVLGVDSDYLFGIDNSYPVRDPGITETLNEETPGGVKLETVESLRAETHAYIDRLLDACKSLRQMIWTVEELRRHFPLSSISPSEAQSVAKRAAGEPDTHPGS